MSTVVACFWFVTAFRTYVLGNVKTLHKMDNGDAIPAVDWTDALNTDDAWTDAFTDVRILIRPVLALGTFA